MPARLDPAEFDRRYTVNIDGCWYWHGPRAGRYGLWGRRQYAHREAWERANGPVPEGLVVMHSCDHPLCVNPAHLSVGTQAENLADMGAKGRDKWRHQRADRKSA